MIHVGDSVGEYLVEANIASGGMAEVYRVRHVARGTLHALKVLVLRTHDIKRRLVQEGQIQASLKHPHAVDVTDTIEVDGHPGLVMEYIDGPTLTDWVLESSPSFHQIEDVFRQVLSAIAAAHEIGLIHRDIKPSNVMLAETDGSWTAKVIDFGLAKVVDDEEDHTRSGVPMGTPAYMAPEQIADAKHVDRRADLFSLGALLYYMCTGEKAFRGEHTVDTYNAVLSGSYTPVREIRPDTPGHLAHAIEICLRVDPARRVQSAAALAHALDRTQQRPPTPPAQKVMFATASAGIAVGAFTALAGLFAFGWWLGSHPAKPVSYAPELVEIGESDGTRPIRTIRDPGFCGAMPGQVLGFAQVPRKARRADTWTFQTPTPLVGRPGGRRLGCTLPRGTHLDVVEKPSRESGDLWIAVYGDAFELP